MVQGVTHLLMANLGWDSVIGSVQVGILLYKPRLCNNLESVTWVWQIQVGSSCSWGAGVTNKWSLLLWKHSEPNLAANLPAWSRTGKIVRSVWGRPPTHCTNAVSPTTPPSPFISLPSSHNSNLLYSTTMLLSKNSISPTMLLSLTSSISPLLHHHALVFSNQLHLPYSTTTLQSPSIMQLFHI